MPDNDVWPPKPDTLDPLTEYDEVIAAKLAALSESKSGPSRLLLTKALREEKGMDLRQAYTFVTSYCDRNGVLVRPKASPLMTWLGCALPLSLLCYAGYLAYWMKRRDEILSQPHHHAAFLALSKEALTISSIALLLAFVNLGVQVIRFRRNRKK